MESSMQTYKSAIKLLNGLQSNASRIQEVCKDKETMHKLSLPEMETYLGLIGYKPENLDKLNLIHITGTKGKGSTAAFLNNLLLKFPDTKLKVGMFTSPHLVEVRERIRINNEPINQDKFSQYFFHCYNLLFNKNVSQIHPHLPDPSYFRFLTLLAFHIFMEEKVDAAILEVGIGGQYDSTNIIKKPVVCGITHLGIDHVNLLGDTVEQIAWHKAGIMKKGRPAFIIPQQSSDALQMVKDRAIEIGAKLELIEPLTKFSNYDKLELKLSGDHQLVNAALAYNLYKTYLNQFCFQLKTISNNKNQPQLSKFVIDALNDTQWVGRSYHYNKFNVNWYLDGAHTETSLLPVFKWINQVKIQSNENLILLFNPADGRDFKALWNIIQQESNKLGIRFTEVLLTPNIRGGEHGIDQTNSTTQHDPELTLQHQIKELVEAAWPDTNIKVYPTIYDTINQGVLNKLGRSYQSPQVLVTGSLHLVGGVLSILDHPVV